MSKSRHSLAEKNRVPNAKRIARRAAKSAKSMGLDPNDSKAVRAWSMGCVGGFVPDVRRDYRREGFR